MYRILSALGALVFLSGCAGGNREMAQRPPSGFDGAARLVDQGRYDEALPIFRCIARQGEGFEIAQYLAGHSALALSRDETTPTILRDELRVEGFDRLVAAGNAGWPAAQAELAEAFAGISADEALLEAAVWARIYRGNARERSYGLDRLDNSVEADIEARLDPLARAEARDRSAAFRATPLTREAMTPECAQHVRSGRGGSASGREGSGPRGGGRSGNGTPRGGSNHPGGPSGL